MTSKEIDFQLIIRLIFKMHQKKVQFLIKNAPNLVHFYYFYRIKLKMNGL